MCRGELSGLRDAPFINQVQDMSVADVAASPSALRIAESPRIAASPRTVASPSPPLSRAASPEVLGNEGTQLDEAYFDGLRELIEGRISKLADITVEKLGSKEARGRVAAALADSMKQWEVLQSEAEEVISKAGANVAALSRAQLEEVRALRSPPRIVREALGLVYILLEPATLADTVEHVPWNSVLAALSYEKILAGIADFPISSEATGVLHAVPAIRKFLEALRDLRPTSASGVKPGTGSLARGRTKVSLAKNASNIVAKQLQRAPVRCDEFTPRHRSIVCGREEPPTTENREMSGTGLLSILRLDAGSSAISVGSSELISRPVGLLLEWALAQLRLLEVQARFRASPDVELEKGMKRELRFAEKALEKLDASESKALRRLTDARRKLDDGRCWVIAAAASSASSSSSSSSSCAGSCVGASTVRFSKGSALLSSLARRPLDTVIASLNDNPSSRVMVEGHTAPGEVEELASFRAAAVAKYFQSKGIASSRYAICACRPQELSDGPGPIVGEPCVRFSALAVSGLLPREALLFVPCSDAVNEQAKDALQVVGEALREAPFVRLRIEGHTCSLPMWLGNRALADGRAQRVMACLEALGVPRSQLTIDGCGEKMPLAAEESDEAMAANRRVELHILAPETLEALSASVKDKPPEEALAALARAAANLYRLPLGDAVRHAAAAALAARGVHWGGALAQVSLRAALV